MRRCPRRPKSPRSHVTFLALAPNGAETHIYAIRTELRKGEYLVNDKDKSLKLDVVAKKLRTGELAVWDPQERAIVLVSTSGGTPSARVIKGATFKALTEVLGSVVVLI